MEPPLVSAIVPTYNRVDLVGRAIESILGQTYRNIEVVVVDDGSTDATQAILRSFGNRITAIWQHNAGPSAARNRGLLEAKGEFVSFLDSDDLWMPKRIEKQIAVLRKAGPAVPCCVSDVELRFNRRATATAFHNFRLMPKEHEGIWLNPLEVIIDRFILFNQMATFRKAALQRVRGYDINLRLLEDYDLAVRLSLLGPFAFSREVLSVWHQGSPESLSTEAYKQASRVSRAEVAIRLKLLRQIELDKGNDWLRERMQKALKKARRRLRIATLRETGHLGKSTAGTCLALFERCLAAAHRRSPWFSQMKTAALKQDIASPSQSVIRLEEKLQNG